MKPAILIRCLGLATLLLAAAVRAEDVLILPHPALLRGQQQLRQAEQYGAAAMLPGAVLAVQEKINAAWSAYHRQVEEEASDPGDEEAVLARQLAEEAAVDAELLRVSVRTRDDEARLDGLRAGLSLPLPNRMEVPAPGSITAPATSAKKP